VVVLLIVLGIVVVALRPALVLFCVFTIYAISGPVYTIRTVRKLKMKHVVGEDDDSDDEFDAEAENKDPDNKETTQEPLNVTDLENTDEKKS
jgi:CDP-diacylglycerol--serine O-phosphatidyltransferase